MRACKLLIVDDEPSIRSALRRTLRNSGYRITTAGDGVEALAVVESQPPGAFAVAIVDLQMPRMGGLDLLAEIKRRSPETQVLLLTAHGTIATAVQAMRLGADDFLEKPFDQGALRERVRAGQRVWLARQSSAAREFPERGQAVSQYLIGQSEKIRTVRRAARIVGDSDATLLICGESGTGKEQFAKAVHCGSSRAGQPFVAIDTSALSATVIESELFGHCKGAFTGADQARQGLLVAAGRGTIFLDEIGDLPLNAQTRLLRALQDRQVRPVGSEKTVAVAARFIAATNKDLAAAVARGEFRDDLYHRLNVVRLTMPPLREFKEDIPVLAEHFLEKYAAERPGVRGIADQACAALTAYDWPGNVRELENAILRGLVMGSSELIQSADLPVHIVRAVAEGLGRRRTESNALKSAPPSRGTLAACEREAIITALDKSNGNRARAAERLGIGVATLYRKLKRYQIS